MNLLAKLNQAERLLAETKDLGELKQIHDVAVAAEAYAKAHGLGKELRDHAVDIQLLASRRIGELSEKPTPQESGERGGRGKKGFQVEKPLLTPKRLFECRKLADIPQPEFDRRREALRAGQERFTYNKILYGYAPRPEPAETPPLPEGVYNVILADPPWRYEFSETESRAIENKYPTMNLDKIKALKVPAADSAILFLWTTAPKVQEAIEVMIAWGFSYRTCAVWDKEKIGMGYWFRIQHELLLVGVKNKFPVPAPSDRVRSVIHAPRGKHSQKPEVVYEIIEAMFPKAKLLELFARRNERPGWITWGNEAA